jgi:hypothetical protein
VAKAISSLFGYLATDFAALIGRGMDVEIPLAGHQVGGLGIGQRRLSFERAFCGRIRENWDLHAGVIARFGRSVEMGCGCRAGQTGITAFVRELLAGGVVSCMGPDPLLSFGGTSLAAFRSALKLTISAMDGVASASAPANTKATKADRVTVAIMFAPP